MKLPCFPPWWFTLYTGPFLFTVAIETMDWQQAWLKQFNKLISSTSSVVLCEIEVQASLCIIPDSLLAAITCKTAFQKYISIDKPLHSDVSVLIRTTSLYSPASQPACISDWASLTIIMMNAVSTGTNQPFDTSSPLDALAANIPWIRGGLFEALWFAVTGHCWALLCHL